MGKPSLKLYIDVVSPFAYIAFHVVRTSPVFKDCDVTFIPVFLGGIMKACGNTPPIQIENKGEWIGKERLRWAHLFNIPMAEEMPPGFPRNTVQVQRALAAVALLQPEKLTETIATLYHMLFVERREIHTLELLGPVFSKILGERPAKEILTKATSDEVKKLLSTKTNEALEEGAFGLPWFVATNAKGENECYWGFDHIAQVTNHLGLEKPKPDNSEGGWRAML
ncbi:hypothetical protein ABVK25_002882 [Lepraria finkii]|uniref:Glutathione S-transferase kappa n=1 Tax=Lepraria finkii TaxID=1340010 RepID=A0ABR4BMI3_9LECA